MCTEGGNDTQIRKSEFNYDSLQIDVFLLFHQFFLFFIFLTRCVSSVFYTLWKFFSFFFHFALVCFSEQFLSFWCLLYRADELDSH